MTASAQTQLPPIPASIDNVTDWEGLAQQIASEAGLPAVATPDMVVGMIGSAVPLLFEADTTKNADVLRGTFTDAVIAQCQRNLGHLFDGQPTSATVHLVGAPMVDGHPVFRAHVFIRVRAADGSEIVDRQFWDLRPGAEVTVGQSQCPNCGGPIATGELICAHCHTDVRSVVSVPLVVSRLELY